MTVLRILAIALDAAIILGGIFLMEYLWRTILWPDWRDRHLHD